MTSPAQNCTAIISQQHTSPKKNAVRPGRSADALLERLDRIHELALPVYHTIGEAVRQYVLAHGVDPLEIDREFLRDLFGDER